MSERESLIAALQEPFDHRVACAPETLLALVEIAEAAQQLRAKLLATPVGYLGRPEWDVSPAAREWRELGAALAVVSGADERSETC